MNWNDLIENKGVRSSEFDFKYIPIADFDEIEFSYGVCKKGWYINENNESSLIPWDEGNYISFIKLLEIPSDLFIKKIKSRVIGFINNDNEIISFFPFLNVTKTAFKMESVYWCELNLNILIKESLYSNELIVFLKSSLNKKWISQKLKHQIKTYINNRVIPGASEIK